MSYTNKFRLVLASIALLGCFLAPSAMATTCQQDAKALYDSCVTFQFVLNGTLSTFSEQACAEASAEATNACIVASGKLDPQYSECRVRYNFFVSDCATCNLSGWYSNQTAFVNGAASHFCRVPDNDPDCSVGYNLFSANVTCS